MPIIAGKNKVPAQGTPGWHGARLVAVHDLGTQKRAYMERPKPMLQLDYRIDEQDVDGNAIIKTRDYNNSLDARSALLPAVRALLNDPGFIAPHEGLDLEQLIGKPCRVKLDPRTGRNGGVFCNITEVAAHPRSQQPPSPARARAAPTDVPAPVEEEHVPY